MKKIVIKNKNQSFPTPHETQGSSHLDQVQAHLEALFFTSDQVLSIQKIKSLLGEELTTEQIKQAIQQIECRYHAHHHGIELVHVAKGYQFRTKLNQADHVKSLSKIQFQSLSPGAMECLAIIAYKQPITKEEMDKTRGVSCSHFIRILLEKEMIQIAGRAELPGRPILYQTTNQFLETFGLTDLSSLPPLRELEQMVPESEVGKLTHLIHSTSILASYPELKEDQALLNKIYQQIQAVPTPPRLKEMTSKKIQKSKKESSAEVLH